METFFELLSFNILNPEQLHVNSADLVDHINNSILYRRLKPFCALSIKGSHFSMYVDIG